MDLPLVLRQVDLLSDRTRGVLLCQSSARPGAVGRAVLLQREKEPHTCKVTDGVEEYMEDLANVEGVLVEPGIDSVATKSHVPLCQSADGWDSSTT